MPRLTPSPLAARGGKRNGFRTRRGLTLAELLVVLVLFGIVGTAIVRTMVKQRQFYKDQGRLLEGRRELRLGASVLPLDLRSISTSDSANGTDIISRSESELVMRVWIGSSIVCAKTANTISVPPTNLARHTLTSWFYQPEVGDTAFIYDENLLKGSEDDLWRKYAITAGTPTTAVCPGAPYTDAALDAGKSRFTFTLTGVNIPIPDSVKVGAVVRFTRAMRYRIEQMPSGDWYLTNAMHSSGAWSSASAVAGPFRAFVSGDANPSGLQFRYFDTTGTRIMTMNGADRIGRIDVAMRTSGGNAAMPGRQGALLTDSLLMRIAIRNAR